MELTKKFRHIIKNNQTRHLSKTWHQRIVEKQVLRNHFLATGSMVEAKNFTKLLNQMQPREIDIYRRDQQPVFEAI